MPLKFYLIQKSFYKLCDINIYILTLVRINYNNFDI